MKTKKGQILIITLLVLTVIAIITVSLVGLVNRDIQQVASNEQYEDAYNTSETQLKKVLDKFASPNTDISTLPTTFNSPTDLSCTTPTTAGRDVSYTCTATSTELSTVPLYTEIVVKDTDKVNQFPIYKDRTFDINLNGYVGTIEFFWDKNAAIEFALTYRDASGTLQIIRDVYDPTYVYDSYAAISDQPYNDLTGIHPFNFRDIPTRADATSVAINLSETLTLGGTAFSGTTVTLSITPRMQDKYDSILFNANATSGGLPNQIREFTSKSYNVNGGDSTPVANIETKIPLSPQPDSVLDASLLTNGILKNGP